MTVKEFLRDIRKNKIRIKVIENEISELQETVGCKAPVLDPNGGGRGSRDPYKNEELIARMIDLKHDLEKIKFEYMEDVHRATKMILELPEGKTLEVFSKRYLEFQSWEKIADSMGISFQWVHILHKRGLQELQKKYPYFK